MINDSLKYVFNLIILVLIQVLIINNIPLSWFINPFIYISFIITLPLFIPGWFLLILGFVTGLIIDISCNTPGMHTSATLVMSFIRPYFLNSIIPREDHQSTAQPVPSVFGMGWFMKYALVMTLSHHLVLFFIEEFSFSNFFSTLFKVVLSSVISLLLIFIVQMFSGTKTKIR
ncbi:MAG: rod shape-determining protein MreD [Marinilabiliaceae bacterium]|nr:rod shape-determining protein MreD [Marinilabiliaceae bacterium]